MPRKKGKAQMPGSPKSGFITGCRKLPSRSAAPSRSKSPQAAIKGNREGRTRVNQRDALSAEAASIAAG